MLARGLKVNSKGTLQKLWLLFSLAGIIMQLYFLSLLSLKTTNAEQPALKNGDWAIYNVKTLINTNTSKEKIVEIYGSKFIDILNYYEAINNSKLKLVINEINSNGYVKFSVTRYFSNGTTEKDTFWGNIMTGSGNLSMWLISPNLEVGDPIYISNITNVPDVKIIEKRQFAGAERETVFSVFHLPALAEFLAEYGIFWDRQTGILCRMGIITDYSMGNIKLETRMIVTIEETNLWSASSDSSLFLLTVIAVLLFAILLILFLLRKKRIKKRRR